MKIEKILLTILIFLSLPVHAEIFATLDSLIGKAEVQRAGTHSWVLVKQGEKLYNNDIFKVSQKGFARIVFPDKGAIYVRYNSQIMINLLQRNDQITLNHATVFFGAVFFVIKHALPLRSLGIGDTKIYTPTAVISLRGTSFNVEVDSKNGATDVEMLNGTVLVRNIIRNVSIYLGSPYKTRIDMNSDPLVPSAVLKSDIDALKSWAPIQVIEQEMTAQLAQSKRDKIVITGKFEDKCVILPFVNESNYDGPWKVADAITKSFSEQLQKSTTRLKISAADSFPADPIEYVKEQKARFLISGVIETFEITQRAEITARADEYRELVSARVRIRIQLTDASDKSIISDEVYTGEVTGKNKVENTWKGVQKLNFDLHDPTFTSTLIGTSTKQAVDMALEKITKYMGL